MTDTTGTVHDDEQATVVTIGETIGKQSAPSGTNGITDHVR